MFRFIKQVPKNFNFNFNFNFSFNLIAIANLGGPVKRKINWKEKKGKEKEGKLQF